MTGKMEEQLHDIFSKLNDMQKKEVLDFAAKFVSPGLQYDKWKDPDFVSEMESRYNYYKSGGKMVSAEELEEQVKEIFKKANGAEIRKFIKQ